MKIAYLIAAHTDPHHLARLVDSLMVDDNTDFYIHLDKRVVLGDYSRRANLDAKRVKWVGNRILVQWGGVFSMSVSNQSNFGVYRQWRGV